MSENQQHLLLLRFSALGDILMTVPVVEALAQQYPEVRITMVSRPYVASIFHRLPGNVTFLGINPREYTGVRGLHRLYRKLYDDLHPTHVCDLHDVLRTKYIRMGFLAHRIPVSHIIKDRQARKRFISQQPKVQQETSFERYAKALAEVGFPIQMDTCRHPFGRKELRDGIGIAPFAAHQGKIYPTEKMEEVVKSLTENGQKVYIFGAGKAEKETAETWATRYPGAESMVGKLKDMASEADFMAGLKVMVTMDSGNMHLASLTDTPVVSIWGATHPLGGFLGWGQKMENTVQADLPCRPCSTFGNKPCRLGGYPCLYSIEPETIADKVLKLCR